MDIQMAAICDYAADYDGKLCLIGCFDTIAGFGLPVEKKDFTIALRLTLTPEDTGIQELGFIIIDADGNPLDPLQMPFYVDIEVDIPDSVSFLTRNYILNCYGMEFEEPGEYSCDLLVNGSLAARMPFKVGLVSLTRQTHYSPH